MGLVESGRISSRLSAVSVLILVLVQQFLSLFPQVLSALLFIMAVFVSPSRLERIKMFFSRQVAEGENPRKLFSLPVYLRKNGCVLRVGCIAQVENTSETNPPPHCIKDILISQDLNQIFCCLVPVLSDETSSTVVLGEELMVDAENVKTACDRGIALDILQEGMELLQRTIETYPIHIQRMVRRHQLCSTIRRDVQRFLSGFSIVHSWTVGAVDWRLDPGILGLERETAFSVDFHIEKFENSVSHLDLLFGDCWDVRCISGTAGYRAIITLDLGVDQNLEIKITAHAVLCSETLNPEKHRNQTLQELRASRLNPMLKGLLSTENTLNRPESSFPSGTARSLTWESFRNSEENTLSSSDGSPQRGEALYQAVSLDSSFILPSSSTAAASLQELLRKTNLNSENFYYYSPVEKKRGVGRRTKGPNTSTPADEIEGTDSEDFRDTDLEILNSDIRVFKEITPLEGIRDTPNTTLNSDSSLETISPENSQEMNLDVSNGTLVTNNIDQMNISEKLMNKSSPIQSNTPVKSEILNPVTESETQAHILVENKQGKPLQFITEPEIKPFGQPGLEKAELPSSDKDLPGLSGDGITTIFASNISDIINPGESEDISPVAPSTLENETEVPSSFGLDRPFLVDEPTSPITRNVSEISDLENNNDLSLDLKLSETLICDTPGSAGTPTPPPPASTADSKVIEYINSLPSHAPQNASFTPDKMELSLNLSTRQQASPSGLKSPLFNESRRGRMNSDDEGNISVCSSRSRASDLGSMGGRFGQGTLSTFYGVGIPTTSTCPFPDEWQYNTIPEVIENDDEID